MAQTRNMTHLYLDPKKGTSVVVKRYDYWWIFYVGRVGDNQAKIICTKYSDFGGYVKRVERQVAFNWCPKGIDIPASTLYTKIKVMAETTIDAMLD